MQFIFLCLLFLISFQHSAQESLIEKFKKLHKPEKRWVVTHPFVAKKAFHITQQAINESNALMKSKALNDSLPTGGRIDAFRHAYWMALLSNKIGARKALKLGKAHEKANYIQFKKNEFEYDIIPDSVSSKMDLYNNKIGIEIAKEIKIKNKKPTPDEIKIKIIEKIKSGELLIIKKDKNGYFVKCDNEKIDCNLWKGKWGIPKCLVKSNYTE